MRNILSRNVLFIICVSVIFGFINFYVAGHDADVSPSVLKKSMLSLLMPFLASLGCFLSPIFVPILLLFALFDFYLAYKYGLVTRSMLQAIMGTNTHQAISMVSSVSILLPVVLLLVIVGMIVLTWKSVRFRPVLFLVTGALVIVPMHAALKHSRAHELQFRSIQSAEITSYMRIYLPGVVGDFVYMIGLGLSNDNRPAVPHTRTDPAITGKAAGKRRNIVLVVGESAFADRHTTYGYTAQNTTPIMKAMADKGDLCVIHQAHSSANMTRAAVPMLVSFYDPDHQEKLYGEKNLIELARDNGYRTFWIASQPGRGEYARTFGYLSEFSDYVTRQDYNNATNHVTWRDESLLPVIKEKFADPVSQKFFVIHLMGSHESYSDDRTEEDIKALPDADPYDQSLHRTDRILQQIIAMADRERNRPLWAALIMRPACAVYSRVSSSMATVRGAG
ncbi:phosphoethanolamine transferase CptA [Komagataeibacter europaeus]|uniref:Phosphoethanolamine transferase CptA n=2 Tax=Komagataeibacter europaeus TaxID=33995 RepID=A0A0M0ECF7_KOMEU|nr:phosphoethanolamine transferase CptA [Komagataeibacter europaeus]